MKRVQIAVIGGGPAGYCAAKVAAEEYLADTILLSEAFPPIGLLHEWEDGHNGIDYRRGHVVWGLFEDNVLGVAAASESYQLQAEQVILATGSTDLPCPFSGGSIPGVFTRQALFKMTRSMRIMPGKKFVIVGDGQDAIDTGTEIERYGAEVVARVATNQLDSFCAIGEGGVEAVEIDGTRIQADIVVVASGRQPDIGLALMAECAIGFNPELGGFVPVVDEYLRTSKPSILAAGDAAGICEERIARQEGHFAGVCAAHILGLVKDLAFGEERDWYAHQVGDRVNLLKAVQPSYAQV